MNFYRESSIQNGDIQSLSSTTRRNSGTDKIVTPGQVITTDAQFMRGHGTFGKMISTSDDVEEMDEDVVMHAAVAGQVEKVNKLIVVNPIHARYSAEVGDVVVGRIIDCAQKRWKVDINGRVDAILHLASVNLPGAVQRRKLDSDELQMRSFFSEGDLLVAEIQQTGQEGSISLHTRSLKYGKLRNGMLIIVDSQLVQRSKSHFLEFPLGIDVVLGVNGMIWVQAHTPELTMEQVEQTPDILYSDSCIELDKQQRLHIARMANCVKQLADENILLNYESLQLAYQLSLGHQVKDLLDPQVQKRWISKVRSDILTFSA